MTWHVPDVRIVPAKRAAVHPTVAKSLTASASANNIDFALLFLYYSLVKSVFIIPSCINFDPSIPLDYTATRSVYGSQERFHQTLNTISSIRKFSPTSDILLCELSEMSEQQKALFQEKSDYLIYRSEQNPTIFDFFKNHANKSHGVSFAILKSLIYLKNMQFPLYDVYFQISGRYRLNKSFKMEDHIVSPFNAKRHDCFETGIFTTLFSFNKSFFGPFLESMMVTHSFTTNNYPPLSGFSLETNMLYGLEHNINYLDNLGIEGNFGPDGEKTLAIRWKKKI